MIKKVHERISIYVPKALLQSIDQKREDVPRSKFVLRIIEQYLKLRGVS
jgi:metal-responsive CopG/Arc/MetJ family transcriptional regulator